jgi:hypothetical protein
MLESGKAGRCIAADYAAASRAIAIARTAAELDRL